MRKLIWIIVIVAVVGGLVWFKNQSSKPATEENNEIENQLPADEDNNIQPSEDQAALEGVLETSNDLSRGNLMLLLLNSDRIIYFKTSRDFSALIGKSVVVKIEGTLDSFRLIDIEEGTGEVRGVQLN